MEGNHLSELETRFLRYVQIDTQSDETSNQVPSTSKQLNLQRLLAEELENLSASDVVLDESGYVFGTIPATVTDRKLPTVAFLAHVDTAPDYSGTNVRPIVHRAYRGGPLRLPDDSSLVLDEADSPHLKNKYGEDIVTASGTTLLGADDKAGVAIIMTLAAELLADPSIPHGPLRICFTPDEEIGRGVDHLNLEELAADVAYTLDGSQAGEVVYETFSADKATVTITGVAVHPGEAKGKLVNALRLASRFIAMLPSRTDTPETTDGYEGFVHLHSLHGNSAHAEIQLILRDFELDGLKEKGELVEAICDQLRREEPRSRIACNVSAQYKNMRYWLQDDMMPVEIALEAVRKTGLTPLTLPTRGGTDGSRLTERGLPTPNLFTGAHNMHGPLEWISLQDMEKALETCINLAILWAQEGED